MAGNTALAYQSMIEEKLLSAMINTHLKGDVMAACSYSKEYAIFVGVDEDELPIRPMSKIEHKDFFNQWNEYYFNLMSTWGKQIRKNLIAVRKKYGNKDDDIPSGVKT